MVGTRESAKPGQGRFQITFWLDVALLVSVCALQTVRFTGLVLHEWLGLAIVGMVFAHLLLSWSWIASLSRRMFAVGTTARARINYLLNLLLFVAVTAAIFSGILISQKAIPVLIGTKDAPDMDWRWDSLHNDFSQAVLMLAGFHLAINLDWVLAAAQKVFAPRPGRRAVKLVRILSRLALLSLVAAAFVGLTDTYGGSVRPHWPHPLWQAGERIVRRRRKSISFRNSSVKVCCSHSTL